MATNPYPYMPKPWPTTAQENSLSWWNPAKSPAPAPWDNMNSWVQKETQYMGRPITGSDVNSYLSQPENVGRNGRHPYEADMRAWAAQHMGGGAVTPPAGNPPPVAQPPAPPAPPPPPYQYPAAHFSESNPETPPWLPQHWSVAPAWQTNIRTSVPQAVGNGASPIMKIGGGQ